MIADWTDIQMCIRDRRDHQRNLCNQQQDDERAAPKEELKESAPAALVQLRAFQAEFFTYMAHGKFLTFSAWGTLRA